MAGGGMSDRSIAESWTSFNREVLDEIDACEVQRQEMRRAFYAGALGFFDVLTNGLDPNTEATEADETHLDAMVKELMDFGAAVLAGTV
jgi:hypothetical protein